ncbi:MAG: hypothetical protein P8X48_11355 [Acidiferrobacteraceae bacterium]|jgi:hypothetical protein
MNPASFSMATIEKVDAPAGSDGGTWYRYVIDNGKSAITGYRQGSREQVARFARDLTENINARAARGHSAWQPRQKK